MFDPTIGDLVDNRVEWQDVLDGIYEYYKQDVTTGGAYDHDKFSQLLKDIEISADKKGISAIDEMVDRLPNFERYNAPDGSYTYYFKDPVRSEVKDVIIDSNASGGTYGGGFNIDVPSVIRPNPVQDGKMIISSGVGYRPSTGVTVPGVIGTVSSAMMATMTGITLGKTISAGIYKAGQYFGKDLWEFNPKNWNTITEGSNGISSNMFKVLFGYNYTPDKVNSSLQAYVGEDAFAYVAKYMEDTGFFDEMEMVTPPANVSSNNLNNVKIPIPANTTFQYNWFDTRHKNNHTSIGTPIQGKIRFFSTWVPEGTGSSRRYSLICYACSDSNTSKVNMHTKIAYPDGSDASTDNIYTINKKSVTLNGKTAYTLTIYGGANGLLTPILPSTDKTNLIPVNIDPTGNYIDERYVGYAIMHGTAETVPIMQGVGNQSNPRTPYLSKDMSQEDVLLALKEQYPELWENAIENYEVGPDGEFKKKTYIPVPFPNSETGTLSAPESGSANQNNTLISPAEMVENALKQLTDTIAKLVIPPKTGTGTAPEPIIPLGKASSLWAIYNPTQSEIDSFGAWMWSDNPIEQIRKLFSDPIQAIIGVHKVYAPPIIAGRRNIKVGYLDSGVSSNYVGNQYSEVDCGSVSLGEFFGNVLDYYPFTSVNLYLPFVGVVKLDTADVMRSTISVKYGVDVLTGDCLAKVRVERDGAGGILYSFPGNCAVKYPVSSVSYMSIVAAGASVVAGMLTGDMGIMSLAGSFGHGKPTVQHSGAFVGNSGATGPKIPYLIISRPQAELALDFPSLEGIPANHTTLLENCKGFTVVKDVHVEGINATSDELAEIEDLLKKGVIF